MSINEGLMYDLNSYSFLYRGYHDNLGTLSKAYNKRSLNFFPRYLHNNPTNNPTSPQEQSSHNHVHKK